MYDYIFKYVIAGDYSTGKSAIVNRFIQNMYKSINDTTIGVEFGSKIIYVKNSNIKLQIWDTAGQERFRSICTSYFKITTCIFLVFDLSKKETFLNLNSWLDIIKNYIDPKCLICVIGAKSDLNLKNIDKCEIEKFLNDNNLYYFECSSKNNINIDDIFYETSKIILNKINKNIINKDDFNKLGIRPSVNKEITYLKRHQSDDCNTLNCCSIF